MAREENTCSLVIGRFRSIFSLSRSAVAKIAAQFYCRYIMASFEGSFLTVVSYIRGYHVYKGESGWEPQLNEERILKREPNNVKDTNAVAIVRLREEAYHQELSTQEHPNTINKNDEILGHIPLRMSLFVSKFLKRGTNKGKTVVRGKRVNRGAGYGLEIPCQYIFYGDTKMSLPWLKSKLECLGYNVLADNVVIPVTSACAR